LDIRIWLQTRYPAGYPTGKLDSDNLCCVPLHYKDVYLCFKAVVDPFSLSDAEVREAKTLVSHDPSDLGDKSVRTNWYSM